MVWIFDMILLEVSIDLLLFLVFRKCCVCEVCVF